MVSNPDRKWTFVLQTSFNEVKKNFMFWTEQPSSAVFQSHFVDLNRSFGSIMVICIYLFNFLSGHNKPCTLKELKRTIEERDFITKFVNEISNQTRICIFSVLFFVFTPFLAPFLHCIDSLLIAVLHLWISFGYSFLDRAGWWKIMLCSSSGDASTASTPFRTWITTKCQMIGKGNHHRMWCNRWSYPSLNQRSRFWAVGMGKYLVGNATPEWAPPNANPD